MTEIMIMISLDKSNIVRNYSPTATEMHLHHKWNMGAVVLLTSRVE
jgi:hypothetical protein